MKNSTTLVRPTQHGAPTATNWVVYLVLPDGLPQPMSLVALIQQDEQNRTLATLLLPNEVSTSIIPNERAGFLIPVQV